MDLLFSLFDCAEPKQTEPCQNRANGPVDCRIARHAASPGLKAHNATRGFNTTSLDRSLFMTQDVSSIVLSDREDVGCTGLN